MTHYTVQFNSAIPDLATVSSLVQERFKEWLKTGVERSNLSFVGSRSCPIVNNVISTVYSDVPADIGKFSSKQK